MKEEQTLLRQIVLLLLRRHERWLEGASPSELELHNEILLRYRSPFSYDELEAALADAPESFSTGNRFLFLDAIREDGPILPILALEYDFGQGVPDATFQAGLFKLNDGSLVALGLRFEVPHHGSGSHSYYHAQLVSALLQNPQLQLPGDAWLPTSCPALPINALNVGTLLVSMVVSIYGRPYLDALHTERFQNLLRRYSKDMHWVDPRPGKFSRFEADALGRWRQAP